MIGIDEMTIGVDKGGIESYKEQLKADLLTSVSDQLDSSQEAIVTAIKAGWRGASEEKFERDLDEAIKAIKRDLKEEYDDVSARIDDLQSYYYAEDSKLAE